MTLSRVSDGAVSAITVAVFPAKSRAGNVHTYVLNGTLLLDVLIDDRWVTVAALRAPAAISGSPSV